MFCAEMSDDVGEMAPTRAVATDRQEMPSARIGEEIAREEIVK
jgi:hypothetical protein